MCLTGSPRIPTDREDEEADDVEHELGLVNNGAESEAGGRPHDMGMPHAHHGHHESAYDYGGSYPMLAGHVSR